MSLYSAEFFSIYHVEKTGFEFTTASTGGGYTLCVLPSAHKYVRVCGGDDSAVNGTLCSVFLDYLFSSSEFIYDLGVDQKDLRVIISMMFMRDARKNEISDRARSRLCNGLPMVTHISTA